MQTVTTTLGPKAKATYASMAFYWHVASNTRTILICSGKGGVGKTTLTANLGIALAMQGVRTCVLDADFGLRNLDLLLGLENRIVGVKKGVDGLKKETGGPKK